MDVQQNQVSQDTEKLKEIPKWTRKYAENLKEIPKWTQRYTENRTLHFLVSMITFVLLFSSTSGLSYIADTH